MTRKTTETAVVEQILLWYDQAEIVLLRKGRSEFILAVASGDPDLSDDFFIGASMTLSRIVEYQEGKFDLRYAMSHPNLRRYWLFQYDGHQESVDLAKAVRSWNLVQCSLPEAGLFSRSHQKIDLVRDRIADTEETFQIDGSWDLIDFSNFYGQMEDIYYVFGDMLRFDNPNTDANTRTLISKNMDRSWRGGGSYGSYFKKSANDNTVSQRLKVRGVKYNSPGYVSINANKDQFDEVITLLQSYASNAKSARKAYNALHRFMGFNKLLRTDSRLIPSTATITSVTGHCRRLESFMPGIAYTSLVNMADGNQIVAAKILLSLFRRMERLFGFFDQGRVTYEGLAIDSAAIGAADEEDYIADK